MKQKQSRGIKACNLAYLRLNNSIYMFVFGLLGFALGFFSLFYCMFLYGKSTYIPYLVTVDTQGSVIAHNEIKVKQEVPETAIANFMCSYIEDLFNIKTDNDLQVKMITSIYARTKMNSLANIFIDRHYQTIKPFDKKTKSQNVLVTSIVRLTSSSYAIDFILTSKIGDLNEKQTKHKAVITYQIGKIQYTTLNELRLNPLGLFVNEITITDKFEEQ